MYKLFLIAKRNLLINYCKTEDGRGLFYHTGRERSYMEMGVSACFNYEFE